MKIHVIKILIFLSYALHNQTFLLLAYGTYMYIGKTIHFHDNIPRLRE